MEGERCMKWRRKEHLESMLRMRLGVEAIAELWNQEKSVVRKAIKDAGLQSYIEMTKIEDEELDVLVETIAKRTPSPGIKTMKLKLMSEGIRVSSKRVRDSLRRTDEEGFKKRREMTKAATDSKG